MHGVARELLDGLTAEFDVERREYAAADPSGRLHECPATQVIPRDPQAGQLTVVFTGFPGLALRLGYMPERYLPACGCDACDDDPSDLAEDLSASVETLVHTGINRSTPWPQRQT